ncbi:hypothetical protein ANN_23449 [Periplaneta americana]|uniref:Uncharacterized protein n=1 Tax=Periplaneta americana TaxID=6978 RepID=A0ABQ8SL66_PERAM|nr:hypothetical protein ANN_23449 [Periplaneta americana]
MYPEIPLPPKPILTRWGTWLEAVEYYAEHIDSINNVLLALDSEDAVSIDTAKTVTCDISVKNDLAHIQHTFSCIIKTLKKIRGTRTIDDVHIDAGRFRDGGNAGVVARVCRSRLGDVEPRCELIRPVDVDANSGLRLSGRRLLRKYYRLLDDGCPSVPEYRPEVVRALADYAGRKLNKINLRIRYEAVEQVDSFKCFGDVVQGHHSTNISPFRHHSIAFPERGWRRTEGADLETSGIACSKPGYAANLV